MGFLPGEAYEPLSLVPFIFQEANFDGIDWVQQGADMAQLAPLFEIDACIWSCFRSCFMRKTRVSRENHVSPTPAGSRHVILIGSSSRANRCITKPRCYAA